MIFAQHSPNIDYSNISDWSPTAFLGVCIILILTTLLPTVVAVVALLIRALHSAHSRQQASQSESHRTQIESGRAQNAGLMEHQKEQIMRICESHSRNTDRIAGTFERAVESFDKALAKRDEHQADIMRELRVINDKIDDMDGKLQHHVDIDHARTVVVSKEPVSIH